VAAADGKRHRAGHATLADLEQRVAQAPTAAQDIMREGVRRLAAYQDVGYAAFYLDRLGPIATADAHANADGKLLRETARHLAVRMSFEDVVRVAQAKTSRDRLARVRAEVRAAPHEPVELTEHFKPGIEEICALLPPSLARRILDWAERTGRLGKVHFSMHVRTTTMWGFARLRVLASLRWWRPRSFRYADEQAEIERWLALICSAWPLGVDLAREIAELARLVKGYGDTYKRGLANHRRIVAEVVEPALAGRLPARVAVDAVANARVAALADPEGDALSRSLAAVARSTGALRRAAE
jgi:indolepyruvate ferredoxin oxidoreductase beta subunit